MASSWASLDKSKLSLMIGFRNVEFNNYFGYKREIFENEKFASKMKILFCVVRNRNNENQEEEKIINFKLYSKRMFDAKICLKTTSFFSKIFPLNNKFSSPTLFWLHFAISKHYKKNENTYKSSVPSCEKAESWNFFKKNILSSLNFICKG